MSEIDLNVDSVCYAVGGPDDDKRMCMYPKDHDGPHGWEVDPGLSVLANEIAIETGCPDTVALATARYAHQQIEGWKIAAEQAWQTAEIARSLAVSLHAASVAVVAAYDRHPSVADEVREAVAQLRLLVETEE